MIPAGELADSISNPSPLSNSRRASSTSAWSSALRIRPLLSGWVRKSPRFYLRPARQFTRLCHRHENKAHFLAKLFVFGIFVPLTHDRGGLENPATWLAGTATARCFTESPGPSK